MYQYIAKVLVCEEKEILIDENCNICQQPVIITVKELHKLMCGLSITESILKFQRAYFCMAFF